MMLVYLIACCRWVKYAELSHNFYISDSSVGNDLDQIELLLPEGVSIERRKGVGVRLSGDEWTLRTLFLQALPSLVPREMLRIFFSSAEPVLHGSGYRFLRMLGIEQLSHTLGAVIETAQLRLDMKFSPIAFVMLFSYLFVSYRRIAEGGLIHEPRPAVPGLLPLPEVYLQAAGESGEELFSTVTGGRVPESEILQLGRILSVCETVRIPEQPLAGMVTDLSGIPERIVEKTVLFVEKHHGIWLHEDNDLLVHLKLMIAAAIRRLMYRIPLWSTRFSDGDMEAEAPSDIATLELVHQFSDELARLIPPLPMNRILAELHDAAITLSAGLERINRRRHGGIRVRIICFEGLGMSRYIEGLVREMVPAWSVIDASWYDPASDSISAAALQAWDLIVTTYPLPEGNGKVLQISGEEPADEVREKLRRRISEIPHGSAAARPVPETVSSSSLSLPLILTLIDTFFIGTVPSTGDDALLARKAADIIGSRCNDRSALTADFMRRESFGSLRFEEEKIRVLHCRSVSVTATAAGVIRPEEEGTEDTILVLAAPMHAAKAETRVLSELVVAITELPDFCSVLRHGSRSELQSMLLKLYSSRMTD
jgi:mannitol operon transcriptional antiterminator